MLADEWEGQSLACWRQVVYPHGDGNVGWMVWLAREKAERLAYMLMPIALGGMSFGKKQYGDEALHVCPTHTCACLTIRAGKDGRRYHAWGATGWIQSFKGMAQMLAFQLFTMKALNPCSGGTLLIQRARTHVHMHTHTHAHIHSSRICHYFSPPCRPVKAQRRQSAPSAAVPVGGWPALPAPLPSAASPAHADQHASVKSGMQSHCRTTNNESFRNLDVKPATGYGASIHGAVFVVCSQAASVEQMVESSTASSYFQHNYAFTHLVNSVSI
eukprot:1160284-Pelagomonas_calceolata.AAC.4